MKQEGPKEIIIPEQRFLSCYGCKFHSHEMTQSGRNPIYADNCNHDDFPLSKTTFHGNLSKDTDGHIKTPSICPFVKRDYNDGHHGGVGRGTASNFEKTQFNEHGKF